MPIYKNRTTIALGAIAVAMLGYIVLVDEGSLTTGELEGRTGHVVQRFVRSRVKRLDLTHGETHVVMNRDLGEEEDMETFDVGTWALESPIEGPADVDAIDVLLSAVEWLDAQRELTGITAEDRTRFGFDEPRATLVFEVADESHTIRVGGDDPVGEGVYVQVDDPERAYIVGTDFLEALTHDVAHFRSKEMLPDFRTADVSRAELSNAAGAATLERRGQRWWMVAPEELMARGATFDEMLRSVGDLRAERFLGERPDEVTGVSLETPSRSLSLAFVPWPDGSSHEGEERPDVRLSIYETCPEHPSELVARVGDGPIVCVASSAIERLDQPATQYRELRLVSTPDDDVERIEVAVGEERFELSRDDGEWSLSRQVGGEERTSVADPTSIEEWLGELRRTEIASFVPADEAAIAAHGLDGAPSATLTIHRTDDGAVDVVTLGDTDADGVWVRRGEEPQLAQVALSVVDLLRAPAVRFRARTLIERSRDDLASFTVVRAAAPGQDETVHQEGSSWALEAPFAGRADGAAVGDVASALAPLDAVRFVADAPAREHGLERPRFVIRASFDAPSDDEDEEDEDGHDHDHGDEEEAEEADGDEDVGPLDVTLKIGADTEGGAFAQLGDDTAVFVVPAALVEAIDEPLVSRDALSVAASEIASLSFRRGATTHELVRAEAGWLLDGAEAPSEPTIALLDRLGELRAVGAVAYGAAPIARPVLTLVITRREGPPTTLVVGAAEGEGESAWHPVRGDAAVTYRVSAASLAGIIGYSP